MKPELKTYKLSPLWQRAIVGGSIWGALEISLGSALHNLMIPMAAGTVLAFLGVLTVSAIAASDLRRGFFWRAAIICALLKAVSPSAVILPPMMGIMLEGFLIELGILLLGANVFGLLVGGGLALLSVPLFKAVRLYMLYGQSIVDFLKNLLEQLALNSQIDISNPIIYSVLLVYFSLGVVAAILGYSLGRKRKSLWMNQLDVTIFAKPMANVRINEFILLGIHFSLLIIYLWNVSQFPKWLGILVAFAYILTVVIYYQRPRKLLLKPFFVLPLVALSFSMPLFTLSLSEVPLSGTYILARALFVVVALAAIGSELSKPSISHFFSNSVLSPVYYASSIAFNALPLYLNTFTGDEISVKGFIKRLNGIIGRTSWSGIRPVILITGGLGEGKSTYLERLIEHLGKNKMLHIRGFIAKGIGPPPLRDGYELKTLPKGENLVLCQRVSACGLPNKSFEFDQEVIRRLTSELVNINPNEILVVDEVGRMELYGEVWSDLISHHLANTSNPLIFTVRRENLMHVVDRWGLSNAYLVDIRKDELERTAGELQNLLAVSHNSASTGNKRW